MRKTVLHGKPAMMNAGVRRLLKANLIEGLIHIDGVKTPLLRALDDRDKDIRYNAASALYTIGARAKKAGKKNPFNEKTWKKINHELTGVGHKNARILDSLPAAHLDQDPTDHQ